MSKEIQSRLERGYTMAIYGTSENIHRQMTEDIETLLKAINYSRSSTQLKDKYGEDFIVFLKSHTKEQPVESIYWYKGTGYTNLDELYKKWLKITKPLIV